jgi:ribosomal protein RSM22 (predicted rRNA methylase)
MIKKAAQALSERYRKGEKPYLRSIEDRHAYMVTRYPATEAALMRVLEEMRGREIRSYLDVGAGPGVSWDAMLQAFPSLQEATFVELDHEFIKIGKGRLHGKPITWQHALSEKSHDLVLFSYSWGEIRDLSLLNKAWDLSNQFLVIIEPGTPRGYEAMLEGRDEMIKRGAHVMAPCPHSKMCPRQGSSEWCHFAVRLERSREHQWAKEGKLGYEDEKFSYIILSKKPEAKFYGRMVKDLLRRKGHTLLTLCTDNGIEVKTITKSNDNYKNTNKLNWGDKIIKSI